MKKDYINIRKTIDRSYMVWLKNCIRFYFQRSLGNFFCKRDPKLWAFGAWEGMKYSDNSKYLFQYVLENVSDIKCVWFTKNESVFEKLKAENFPVQLIGSDESNNLQKRAGIAFYTNGLDDFGDNPYIYGARLVCLWHGIGIKKNYSTRKIHSSEIVNWIAKYKAYVFSYIYRDLTIASSDYVSNLYRRESLTQKPIYVIGQPRNDVFVQDDLSVSNVFSRDFIERFNLNDNTVIITYMPTYRGNKESQIFLDNLIKSIIENEELNEFLQSTKAKFLIKTHYLTDTTNMKSNGNFILLDDRDIECVQRLLKITNILITDYSTCSIDYAIQRKPLVFFTPDLAQYNTDNGLYKEFLNIISENKKDTVDELITELKKCYMGFCNNEIINKINNLYNTNVDLAGDYCCETLKEIRNHYKI